MNEKDYENEHDQLTKIVIGAAIEVHRQFGPGLLESTYEECLGYELSDQGISFRRQLYMPMNYKGRELKKAYKLDFLIENQLILELKAIDRTLEVHEAQILTYLKLSGVKRGLLINFQVPMLKLGIKRFSL